MAILDRNYETNSKKMAEGTVCVTWHQLSTSLLIMELWKKTNSVITNTSNKINSFIEVVIDKFH